MSLMSLLLKGVCLHLCDCVGGESRYNCETCYDVGTDGSISSYKVYVNIHSIHSIFSISPCCLFIDFIILLV